MRSGSAVVLFLLFLLCPLQSVFAATVEITTGTSTVSQVIKYTEAQGVELKDALAVIITDPFNASQCTGGWISTADDQYETVAQIILSAKITLAPIRLAGDPANLFVGSSDKFCYLHFVALP